MSESTPQADGGWGSPILDATQVDRAVAAFRQAFGDAPTCAGVAPGRVEVLGNHTDYNGGLVLAAAIDRTIVVVGRESAQPQIRIVALDCAERAEFGLAELLARDTPATSLPTAGQYWADLMRGSLRALYDARVSVLPFDAVLTGSIPIGAGLSSSAALTVATAMLQRGLQAIAAGRGAPMSRGVADLSLIDLARAMQQAEHLAVGVRCGLLDPFASLHGRQDALLVLDSAAATGQAVSFGGQAPALVVIDSKQSRALGQTAYNDRRDECERAAAQVSIALGRPVPHLCSVTPGELAQAEPLLDDDVCRRARHVISEQARVREAIEAVQAGDAARLGALMRASQLSSMRDFDNSTDRLDLICRIADAQPECDGGRLCGAGWGGCTIHLVAPDAAAAFAQRVASAVETASSAPVEAHVLRASDGASYLLHPLG